MYVCTYVPRYVLKLGMYNMYVCLCVDCSGQAVSLVLLPEFDQS